MSNFFSLIIILYKIRNPFFLDHQVFILLYIFRFKESTHLRKHLYTHTGERPHFCSFCSKGFQTSSDLKRHKKTRVHQERVDQCNNDKASGGTNTDSQTDKGGFPVIFMIFDLHTQFEIKQATFHKRKEIQM